MVVGYVFKTERTGVKEKNLRYLKTVMVSSFRVTTVASVACKDISLDRASDVLLCDEANTDRNHHYSQRKCSIDLLLVQSVPFLTD